MQFDVFTNDLDAGIGSVQSLFALNSVILNGSSSKWQDGIRMKIDCDILK